MQVEPKLLEKLNWRLHLLLENASGIVYTPVIVMVFRPDLFEIKGDIFVWPPKKAALGTQLLPGPKMLRMPKKLNTAQKC